MGDIFDNYTQFLKIQPDEGICDVNASCFNFLTKSGIIDQYTSFLNFSIIMGYFNFENPTFAIPMLTLVLRRKTWQYLISAPEPNPDHSPLNRALLKMFVFGHNLYRKRGLLAAVGPSLGYLLQLLVSSYTFKLFLL